MKQLKISLHDLELAFDNSDYDSAWYLDTVTGEVLPVSREAVQSLNDLLVGIESIETAMSVIEKSELPDLQRQELLGAVKVDFDKEGRFRKVPRQSTREGYDDMGTFIKMVMDKRLQEDLEEAIHRSRPLRRFKDTVSQYPDLHEQWHQFSDERQRQRMLHWLHLVGIEPIFE